MNIALAEKLAQEKLKKCEYDVIITLKKSRKLQQKDNLNDTPLVVCEFTYRCRNTPRLIYILRKTRFDKQKYDYLYPYGVLIYQQLSFDSFATIEKKGIKL